MNQLVVFDVDGTLCDTYEVDYDCFLATAAELLDLSPLTLSWDTFPHVTDAGIVAALWQQHLGRAPTPVEVETFAVNFESKLLEELERSPKRFNPIAGAPQLLAHLQNEGVQFVFATGGWGRTARLKLRAACLPTDPLLASSDDSHDRSEIFRLAMARSMMTDSTEGARIVLVGDGVWDVRVASQLNWSLVGIGRDQRAEQLRDASAGFVIRDFMDLTLANSCASPLQSTSISADALTKA